MQKRHYKTILFFISATILVTLGIQGYWNYKNYQTAKQQFINEVQIGLDNAVNTYYADLAEENLIGFSLSDHAKSMNNKMLDSIFTTIDSKFLNRTASEEQRTIELISGGDISEISLFSNDSHTNHDTLFRKLQIDATAKKNMIRWSTTTDSLQDNPLASLTTRVIFAISNDSLRLPVLDSLVQKELLRKSITASYSLQYTPHLGNAQTVQTAQIATNALKTNATSTYLPEGTNLSIAINNATAAILKRNSIGLLLSLIFAIAVISCLLYLLKIINHQKQLAEVKNDLISNITHEFKTPLATIGAAVEGIQTFNKTNDPEKNKRYAEISSAQVNKLTGMVEKLLETATLDSDKLPLHFESCDLNALLERVTQKDTLEITNKTIQHFLPETTIIYPIDVFHFENALNNIIDNAIKYGGNTIEVTLITHTKGIEISISDSGTTLTTAQKQQIFEKFYRIPKGNTHDVKGFGIGLYYTKKIIEKHNGTISVTRNLNTQFKIVLPHATS